LGCAKKESSSWFGEVVFDGKGPQQGVGDAEAVRDDLTLQLEHVEEGKPCGDGDEFHEACRSPVGYITKIYIIQKL